MMQTRNKVNGKRAGHCSRTIMPTASVSNTTVESHMMACPSNPAHTERSVVLVQSSGPLISMAREARAACKGQAIGCCHGIVQGIMRGVDRELAEKCACAGAPVIS